MALEAGIGHACPQQQLMEQMQKVRLKTGWRKRKKKQHRQF